MSDAPERPSGTTPSAGPARLRFLVGLLPVFVLALAYHLWLEYRSPALHGVDGYYHTRLTWMYATGEFSLFAKELPWMSFGSYGRHFADWQVGYHVLLMPFLLLGLVTGGKLSAAFFATLLTSSVHGILRAHRVPLAWAFALLSLVASGNHLSRMHLVRPTTLLVVVLLWTAHFAAARRPRAFLASALLLLFVYDVPHNLLAVTGLAVGAWVALEGRIPWKIGFAGLAAVLLAIPLHPGFWTGTDGGVSLDNGLFRVWSQMSGSLQSSKDAGLVEVEGALVPIEPPGEFKAPSGRLILEDFQVPLWTMLLGLVLLGFRPRGRTSPLLLVATGLSGLYFWLFLAHLRFFEYWIPFALLAAGLAFGRAVGDDPLALVRGWRTRPRLQALAWTFLALFAVGVLARNGARAASHAAALLSSDKGIGDKYEEPMRWLAENSEEGDLVFHESWPGFAPMFFYNRHNRYVIGLDPYFFYQDDPLTYRDWAQAANGALDPIRTWAVARDMGARWVIAKRNSELARRFAEAPRTEETYSDRRYRVFRIDAD